MMRYSEQVLDHFEQPRNCGALELEPGRVVSGSAGQVETGARVEIDLAVDGPQVTDVRFRAFGCPQLIAAASLATENSKMMEVARLTELRPLSLAEQLGLPPNKLGVLLVLEDAILAAARAADGLYDDNEDGDRGQ